MKTYHPKHEQVLLQLVDVKPKGGIILPENTKIRPMGIVKAIGNEVKGIEVGETVCFFSNANYVKLAEGLVMMSERAIYASVEGEDDEPKQEETKVEENKIIGTIN